MVAPLPVLEPTCHGMYEPRYRLPLAQFLVVVFFSSSNHYALKDGKEYMFLNKKK
jgi:hypothetical protein